MGFPGGGGVGVLPPAGGCFVFSNKMSLKRSRKAPNPSALLCPSKGNGAVPKAPQMEFPALGFLLFPSCILLFTHSILPHPLFLLSSCFSYSIILLPSSLPLPLLPLPYFFLLPPSSHLLLHLPPFSSPSSFPLSFLLLPPHH